MRQPSMAAFLGAKKKEPAVAVVAETIDLT